MLNDTQALSKATSAAGHQRVVDRQTGLELHVKSPFHFKMKIKLKHTRTHTQSTPPPYKKIPSSTSSLCSEILSPPEDVHVATSIFLQIFLFHFFLYSSNGSCSGIARHVFASLELVGVFGDRLMTARLSGSNESHCSFTQIDIDGLGGGWGVVMM